MNLHHEAARPILFEMVDSEYSYFGLGSSVLLSTSNQCYWVTARHVMENQGQDAETLRIYPSEASRSSIPFNFFLNIEREPQDPDFSDLYILQVDGRAFNDTGDAILTAQRVEDGLLNPATLRVGDELIVVGYPEESRAVDYEDFKIKYQRSVYVTCYSGDSPMKYCHQMKFREDHGLTTFNGLSGSPVYKMHTVGSCVLPKLVGILLRGTVSSNLCHFVSSQVLDYAIRKAES